MPRKTNTEILKKHLMLCEGRDEQEFLIRYLNSKELLDIQEFSEDFQVIDFGGNSELSKKLEILQKSANFDKLESLMIIRDAELDAEEAVREIKSALRKANLPIPQEPNSWKERETEAKREENVPKVGFVLFPTCSSDVKKGTLEDLCLSILSEPDAADIQREIDEFLKKMNKNHHKDFPRIFKTKLHTYFSVHDEYVSLKIGEAAAAGAFDWNNAALEPLKDFLKNVLEEKA